MSNKQAAGCLCLLIAVPVGFFGVLYLFADLWAVFQIRTGRIANPIEGPGLGTMIGMGFLFFAVPVGVLGRELLRGWSRKPKS